MKRVETIGIYGRTLDRFVRELGDLGIRVVIDVRARRGLRGAAYGWANSQALQEELRLRGVGYQHLKELAPPEAVRAMQRRSDRAAHQSKRQRNALAPEFVTAYLEHVRPLLGPALLEQIPDASALLCVEERPEACHRSLLLSELQRRWEAEG